MERSFKRKLFVLSLVAIIIIGATGYMVFGRNNSIDTNGNLFKVVAEIEKNAHELNMLKITYDEYNETVNKYQSKYITSFYKPELIIYADGFIKDYPGKPFEENKLIGKSLDEIKKIGEPLFQMQSLQHPVYFYTSYEVSKVFDDNTNSDKSMHYKHIFMRYIIPFDNDKYPGYKQYTFKREGNDYVLFAIRNLIIDRNKELTYGNEKVEFNKSIKF